MDSVSRFSRRQVLRVAASLPLLAAFSQLAGCSRKPSLDATFLQPWLSHLDLSREEWGRRMAVTRSLGCRQVILQWAGQQNGKEPDWALSDIVMQTLLDTTAEQGMSLRIGLPFDMGWWEMLGKGKAERAEFFERSLAEASAFMREARWTRAANFAGWYIPYELEQYHWAEPSAQQALGQWLASLVKVAREAGKGVPAISTYFSGLETQGSLVTLWDTLLDRASLRPMVQDGVGVSGWDNIQGVEALLKHFGRKGVSFDVVVELFQQVSPDGSAFQARSAEFARVERQLAWAGNTGAKEVIGFAVDPWLLEETEEAKALRRAWLEKRA